MDNIYAQLDLYLTEISLELLGNKIYDADGKRQNKLGKLFEALPTNEKESELLENSNDFLCSLKFQQDFAERNVKDLLEGQLDFVLSSSNTCNRDNNEIMKSLRSYKNDQDLLVNELASFTLTRQLEASKIVDQLNVKRAAVREAAEAKNLNKAKSLEKYYAQERSDLMKECMDLIRVMKYILKDEYYCDRRGELVSYVHAMRSCRKIDKGREMQGSSNRCYANKPSFE